MSAMMYETLRGTTILSDEPIRKVWVVESNGVPTEVKVLAETVVDERGFAKIVMVEPDSVVNAYRDLELKEPEKGEGYASLHEDAVRAVRQTLDRHIKLHNLAEGGDAHAKELLYEFINDIASDLRTINIIRKSEEAAEVDMASILAVAEKMKNTAKGSL